MSIVGEAVRIFTPDESGVTFTDGLLAVTIPSSSLTEIVPDSSYSLTVTATNDVTSRTSNSTTLCVLLIN